MKRAGTWGGARAGAGRPAKGPRPSEPHKRRPTLSSRHPVHVTARVVRGLGSLGRRRAHRAVRHALRLSLARADFRIVWLDIRTTRLELVVEADDRMALARGMQGFQIAAARALNRMAGRGGTVFPDRYRMKILGTRVAVREALAALGAGARACWPQTPLVRIELTLVRTPWRGSPRRAWSWLVGAT